MAELDAFILLGIVAIGIPLAAVAAWFAHPLLHAVDAPALASGLEPYAAEAAQYLGATFGSRPIGGDGTRCLLEVPHPTERTWIELTAASGPVVAHITVLLSAPASLRIVGEDLLKGRDPVLDDPDFDRALHLVGPPDWLSAVLDVETRRRLQWLLAGGALSVEDGELKLSVAGLNPADLAHTVSEAQGVARALSLPQDQVADALLQRASEEPRGGPRGMAALRLFAFHPHSDAAATMATRLEPRPWEVLKALEHLVDHHLDALARCVLQPEVTGILLPPLLAHPSHDVRHAAVAALGNLGTLEAVEPLSRAARGGLKEPALLAIARIRERAGPGVAGALAVLEEAQAGEVSLTAEVRGAVSVVKSKG